MKFDVKIVLGAAVILLLGTRASAQAATGLADAEIDTVTFHDTGWFRRDTTQIIYRETDYTIISVRDRGESIPVSELHQYRTQLIDYLYFMQMLQLKPRMDAFEEQIEESQLAPEEKLNRIDGLIDELEREQMIVEDAPRDDIYQFYVEKLRMEGLQVAIGILLKNNGYDVEAEGFKIQLRDDRVIINGEILQPGEAQEYLEYYHHYITNRKPSITIRFQSGDS